MIYYIQVTFDTEGIKRKYPNPSLDQNNPTDIKESFCYMVANSANLTGTISRQLVLVDTQEKSSIVRFYGASASNNFEDSAIIYSITREAIGPISTPYTPVYLENPGIVPSIPNTLPPQIIDTEQFYFLESESWKFGKKKHEISFALYNRDDQTGQPTIYGYFNYTAIFRIHHEH